MECGDFSYTNNDLLIIFGMEEEDKNLTAFLIVYLHGQSSGISEHKLNTFSLKFQNVLHRKMYKETE